MSSVVFRELARILEQELGDDPEALKLAMDILDAYEKKGVRGVRRLIAERLEEAASDEDKGGGDQGF